MNFIAAIILCAVFADFLLHMIADILNLRMLKSQLPDQFKGWYDEHQYASSQKYLRDNTRFEWLAAIVNLMLFIGLWFGRGFPLIDQLVRSISDSSVICGIIYIGLLFLLKSFVAVPFSIYSTFFIEERFGFNKTTWKLFISDRCKQFILAVFIGGILLAGVLSFFEYSGPHAWFYCWIAIIVFMIVMQFVVPTWIMPFFNKFKPLEPGELKSAIMTYADSIDFSLNNVFIMDGSKRSRKTNAFFTGFGRHKRIVLYDTLVKNHTIDELVAILAHEMGHYKKKHVLWMLLTGILQTGIMLYLLSLFISSPMLFDAFYLQTPSVYAGLVFFGILFAPGDFFMGILMQYFSRKNEYAADRFAVETTRDSESFMNALKKLAVHNLSNLMPHPLYVILNYSHPPVIERLKAMGKVEGIR
jgi:STE24 endopeptidase